MATARDSDALLLRAWRQEQDLTASSEALAQAAGGLTPTELDARIEGLRAAGYRIDGPAGPGADYRLVEAPARLIADDLCASLVEKATVGREIIVFEETDSTNDLAARAGNDGAPEGLVIFAESQRAGRGRLGRKWVSPPYRNLLFSVLLRPEAVPVERWSELTFCAALAVGETAERCIGRAARIKWPNDVLVDGRKIAGILLETHRGRAGAGFVVVGIGLNVLQQEADFDPALGGTAGSLAMAVTPGAPPLERRAVAALLLERLETLYSRWPDGFDAIMAACEQRGCRPPAAETDRT